MLLLSFIIKFWQKFQLYSSFIQNNLITAAEESTIKLPFHDVFYMRFLQLIFLYSSLKSEPRFVWAL